MRALNIEEADSITALAWTPDGTELLVGTYRSGTAARLLRVAADGRVREGSESSGGEVRTVRPSSGMQIVYGLAEQDAVYRIRNLESGEELSFAVPSKGWRDDARAVDWLPDGCLIAARGALVAHFDPSSGVVRPFERKHLDPVLHVATSPDGVWAVSTDRTKQVRVWRVETGRQARRLNGKEFGAAAFAPEGDVLVQTGGWGAATFRVGGKWEEIGRFASPALDTTPPVFRGRSGQYAFGSGEALMIAGPSQAPRVAAKVSGAGLRVVAIASDGARVAAGDRTMGRVLVWEADELGW